MSQNERATAKQAHTLISVFQKEYKAHGQGTRTFNRYKAKWGFMDVIDDLGMDRAKELIEYYFRTTRSKYSPEDFFYNYDKLDEQAKLALQDAEHRAKLRRQTAELVREREQSTRKQQ